MLKRLLLSRSPGETRAALVADGRLVDLQLYRDLAPSMLGGVYRGRIRKVTGDGRLGFVDVGEGEVLADLDRKSAGRAGWSLTEGATVPVQITQEGRRGRLPRGTTRLAFAGPRLVFLPHGDADAVSQRIADAAAKRAVTERLSRLDREGGAFVARARAEGATEETLAREAEALEEDWSACAAHLAQEAAPGRIVPPPSPGIDLLRDIVDPESAAMACDDRRAAGLLEGYCRRFFPGARPPAVLDVSAMGAEFGEIEDQIEQALSRRVVLPGGGVATIDRTEGMTAIDIDSGETFEGASTGRGADRLNRAAAAEVARQLRLRALGGLVVVDLVGNPRGRSAAAVRSAFHEAFRDDPARVDIDLVERRGVVLISRQWSRRPLDEIVAVAPEHDEGPVPESLDSVVLRALRTARLAAAKGPVTRLAMHLSPAAAAHVRDARFAPAVAELRDAVAVEPAIVPQADWPTSRVEIETN